MTGRPLGRFEYGDFVGIATRGTSEVGNEVQRGGKMPDEAGSKSNCGDARVSIASRLYVLLDTLVAMRMDFGTNAKGEAAATTLGTEKIEGIRLLLDDAIGATKDIIGSIDRPTRSGD
jgi:hypothetical protein